MARYAGNGVLPLVAGFVVICLSGLASSFATPDALDQRLLLAINPDLPRPLLDGVMIAITDYAIPYVAILLACWGLGAEAHARGWIAARSLFVALAVFGAAIALIAFVGFRAKFASELVPIAMTPLIAGGFLFAGESFERFDAAALARVRRIFWLTLVAALLAEVAIEFVDRLGPDRARPLSRANAAWNGALRVIPDEIVRGAGSYPSGHAGAICALLAPLFWIARRRVVRVGALTLAALCAYSRVYLAAHFPSDALAGAAIGAATGTLVTFALDRRDLAFPEHHS
jgi:membrane-associated phospholipid phosphatase